MKLLHELLGSALLLAGISVHADLTAVVKSGCDKWGYAGDYNTMTQEWNGSPFTMETAVAFTPAEGGGVVLPRETWAGFIVQDPVNGHRYVAAVVNREFTASPREVMLQVIRYESFGNISWLGEKRIPISGEELPLRLEFTGKELIFSCGAGQGWTEAVRWTPAEKFQPQMVGFNVDAYHAEVPGEVRFSSIEIEGDGPAVSDKFNNKSGATWQMTTTRGEWFLPAELELKWLENAATSEVFDNGAEPCFLLQLHSTENLGRTAQLKWVLTDYFGRPLAEGADTVELKERFTDYRLNLPKQERNGIYKVTLTASVNGHAAELPLQFAMIPPRRVTPGQLDPTSPYLLSNAADIALFARCGMRLFRGPHWGTDTIENEMRRIAEQGFIWGGTFVGFGAPDESPKPLQIQARAIADAFIKLRQEHPEWVYFIELFNEPENWPPTSRITDLWPFALQMATVFEYLHEAIPEVKLLNGGVTHRNLAFLRKLALAGMEDPARLPDIVAVHGYRSPTAPEFGHEDDIASLRALFGDRPIWNNEDAYFVEGSEASGPPTITSPTATILESDEITQAAYLVRTMLAQLAAGYSTVTQFDGIPNHSVMASRFHHRPALPALAALTWMLPHPVLEKRLTGMNDNLWALAWNSDGERVMTVWTLNHPERVEFTGDGVEIYDAFGNRLEGNSVVAGGMPHYVKGGDVAMKRSAADAVPAWPLPAEKLPEYLGFTIQTGGFARSMEESTVWIEVGNPGDTARTGVIRPYFMNNAPEDWGFRPAEVEVELAPGEVRRFEFTPYGETFDPLNPEPEKGYAALWWSDGYRIAVEVEQGGETQLIPQRKSMSLRGIPYLDKRTVDADDKLWEEVPVFEQMGAFKRNLEMFLFWNGRADYCPSFQLAWNEEGLLLFAKVIDDKHDATQTGLLAWVTDSVQVGVTPNREQISFTNYPVITLATSGPAVLQRATETRAAGELPEVKLATRRLEGTYDQVGVTLYEALIPWSVIGGGGKEGDTIGFCLLFNESDGYWRKGWEGYFVQMGGQIVDPRCFADITLIQ